MAGPRGRLLLEIRKNSKKDRICLPILASAQPRRVLYISFFQAALPKLRRRSYWVRLALRVTSAPTHPSSLLVFSARGAARVLLPLHSRSLRLERMSQLLPVLVRVPQTCQTWQPRALFGHVMAVAGSGVAKYGCGDHSHRAIAIFGSPAQPGQLLAATRDRTSVPHSVATIAPPVHRLAPRSSTLLLLRRQREGSTRHQSIHWIPCTTPAHTTLGLPGLGQGQG